MTKIDFHSEALAFSKVNDQNREATVAIIEKAMKHGATLAITRAFNLVKNAGDDLRKQRIASAPHRQIVKTIETNSQ